MIQLNSLIAAIACNHWNAERNFIFTIITFLTFKRTGVDVYAEVHSAQGRCDVPAKTDLYIYAM